MGYTDSMNLYCFVNNNPVCFRDPNGEFAIMTALAIAGLVMLAAPPVLTETAHFTGQNELAGGIADWSVVHNAAELGHGRHISSIEGLWNEKYSGSELTTGDYVWNSVDVGLSFLPGVV